MYVIEDLAARQDEVVGEEETEKPHRVGVAGIPVQVAVDRVWCLMGVFGFERLGKHQYDWWLGQV